MISKYYVPLEIKNYDLVVKYLYVLRNVSVV